MKITAILFSLCLYSQPLTTAIAAADSALHISADKLSTEKNICICKNWKYHPGDNPAWANPDFDDRSWEVVGTELLSDKLPENGWTGVGWFRLHVTLDSTLHNRVLGLRISQIGASEVYLDGKLLYQFGEVGKSAVQESPYRELRPQPIVFENKAKHILAIRYSNFSDNKLIKQYFGMGFSVYLGDLNSMFGGLLDWVVETVGYEFTLMVASLVLALLHFALYMYDPRKKQNLYFALMACSLAFVAYIGSQTFLTSSPRQLLFFQKLNNITAVAIVLFELLTIYAIFYTKLPRQFYAFVAYGAVTTILATMNIGKVEIMFCYGFIVLGFAETARVGILKGLRKNDGKWIISSGILVLFLGVMYQLLMDFEVLEPIGDMKHISFYGVLSLFASMSVYLAREFAKTSKNLEKQLVQVKELSDKTLEQERRAKEQEIARRVLAADNARKTEELEEARKLQLSMLPRRLPTLAHLDIAVLMKTASEVGGDYYDFELAKDGTLTVAIGDATGHGTKAGTMVASIKSLFAAFGNNLSIPDFFNKCTEIIKRMHLGNLFMAMMLVRIKGHKMVASAAGMPPILIYRNRTGSVEELLIKGMPLGGYRGFDYREKETTLATGDTILLMTDGFAELFNEKKEMLDYPRVRAIFEQSAPKSPKTIIQHLADAGEAWSNGKPQNDDYTFVVLKVRNHLG